MVFYFLDDFAKPLFIIESRNYFILDCLFEISQIWSNYRTEAGRPPTKVDINLKITNLDVHDYKNKPRVKL